MKAICAKSDRSLEVCDVPEPGDPPSGCLLLAMDSSAINHGDKFFLARPSTSGVSAVVSRYGIWGASGAGEVLAAGPQVPAGFVGKRVAVYRSLTPTADLIGLWSEKAVAPYASCLVLPDHVQARDYCGSLANVLTAYGFLEETVADGHKGVVVTAGNSSTGHALAALARRRATPFLALTRSAASRDALRGLGVEHVLATSDEGFESAFEALAAELGATAVFDGVGGSLISRIAPRLPMNSTVYAYGFLGGADPISLPSVTLMTRNLVLRRFSNFESPAVKDRERRIAALNALREVIEDPLLRTRIGREFRFDQIEEAMAYETAPGAKAVLVA